ncbi:Rap1-interacting factor 1 N terminal-domain-containing protein [Emericellopsis atlantica]|uniref:Rap1-interacting factor 1 N terminal-domain-containing protein n=1 Tax=Emericellopsis atlantica TaxID=2614577 RepID=A0A9P8CSU6_9HYPO|nr:Rap1-interacting factor 1 N terminal-domain-containing protein [Emericellopsis atlantica]KAG9256126.1 Rap1-interacting factor 1 N terminal-domain-containing protein [Emericellopsis atlantica]
MAAVMASSTQASTLLDNLPPRPPTPPRDTNHRETADGSASLLDRSLPSPEAAVQTWHTPPNGNSPATPSCAHLTDGSASRLGKRVVWSGRTEYRDPPDYKKAFDSFDKSSPVSLSSAARLKPLKGILKITASPVTFASPLSSQLDGYTETQSIAEMLESTVKHLAGSERDSKLDAYMMLVRGLRSSSNLPDRVALQAKLGLLIQFIQRDMLAKQEDGSADFQLVNQALKTLATFLQFGDVKSAVPNEAAASIMDQAIRTFENPSTSKESTRNFMHIVRCQNFSPKIMTAERVARIVHALHKIEDHVKGKSIIMSRIMLYRRLVWQCRSHMVAVSNGWLKDLFTGMLSTIQEIQLKAIELGLEVGYLYRQERRLAAEVKVMLDTSNEQQTYMEFYMDKMRAMLADKQRSYAAPQIWSVVTLLGRRCPLDQWEHFTAWFTLIQGAFNTSDLRTKQETNYAWNRYACLSLKETSKVTPRLLEGLVKPLTSQLRRKLNEKCPEDSKKLRRTVVSGACTLYYYLFSPVSEQKKDTLIAWDFAVQPVIAQLVTATYPDDLATATRILLRLVDVSTPVLWKPERIQAATPVRPDELPSIDPKWIRAHSDRIFNALGGIMLQSVQNLADRDSPAYKLWKAVVHAVAAASAKDIKVSDETVAFVARSLGLLSTIWSAGCADEETFSSKFLPGIRNYITVLVDNLGLLPLTGKKLSVSVDSANVFEPIATPSHRPAKPQGVVATPLQHLFNMLSVVPTGGRDDDDLAAFFISTFEMFLAGKPDKARIDLVKDLQRQSPANASAPYAVWMLGSQAVALTLSGDNKLDSNGDRFLGPEFREITNFLCNGLLSHPNLPSQAWMSIFNDFSQRVTSGFGDAGRAIVIIEPLAKVLVDVDQAVALHHEASCALIESARFPRDRQAIDAARRRLWGAELVPSKTTDPFDHLYRLADRKLITSYEALGEQEGSPLRAVTVLKATKQFIAASFSSTGFASASRLQHGLSVWLLDEKRQVKPSNDDELANSLLALWTDLCSEMAKARHLERSQFQQLDTLLSAAFQSTSRPVQSKAAETWNAIVREDETPECSDSLKTIVSSLQSKVDLPLAGSNQSGGNFGAQMSSDPEPQPGSAIGIPSTGQSSGVSLRSKPTMTAKAQESTISSAKKRRLDATPEASPVRGSKRLARSSRNTTPRLRHDNSQIQFQPFASSSPEQGESQHLTERQKEVRERQKENVFLGSDAQLETPDNDLEAATALEDALSTPKAKANSALKSTPQKTTYEEHISSTPTPRRGQLIPMDLDNDPPSSPPEVRPYPLLSEIHSRSSAKSALEEQWSSPVASPVPDRQHVPAAIEVPHVDLTNDSTQPSTEPQPQGRQTRSTRKPDVSQEEEVIPSSVPDMGSPSLARVTRAKRTRGSRVNKAQEPPQPPASAPQRAATPPQAAQSSPKSGADDVYVDARASPSISPPPELPDMTQESNDTSFAFSETDDSQFMRFAAEMESGAPVRHAPALTRESSSSLSSVQAGDVSADIVKSTPAEPVEVVTAVVKAEEEAEEEPRSQRKRGKRKSSARSRDTRRKRRRSEEPEPEQRPTRNKAKRRAKVAAKSNARRSARRMQVEEETRELEDVSVEAGPVEVVDTNKGGDIVFDDDDASSSRDTDEEIMSQLVSESNAASQAGSVPPEASLVVIEDSMATSSFSLDKAVQAEVEQEKKEEQVEARSAESIMGMLRAGMAGLQNASLSRDDFNQIEDMLMEMKRELFEAERRGRR